MQIVFDDDGIPRELDVQVNNPTATVGDLLDVLAPGRSEGGDALIIGGRLARAELGLSECGLHEGALVQIPSGAGVTATAAAAVDLPGAGPVLDIVGGVDAGRRFVLGAGETVVGRDPQSDIALSSETVSGQHAVVVLSPAGTMAVRDLGSHNGTWLGDVAVDGSAPLADGAVLRLGAVHAVGRREPLSDRPVAVDPLRHATAAGTVPFNRPPRAAPPPAGARLRAPDPPGTGATVTPLSVISIIAPALFGVTSVFLFHNAAFLLFALLSPIMAIGSWLEGRRQGRKTSRRDQQRYDREMAAFTAEARAAVAAERVRLEALFPDLADVVRRATAPSVRLWERRPGDADFLRLRAGIGPVGWEPPVDTSGERTAAVAELLDELRAIPDAPVPVELADGGVVGIVGERSAAIALARALVCQAAVHHGPADLGIAVLARPDAGEVWDWAKWLPHTRDAGGGTRLLSADRDQSTALLNALVAGAARSAGQVPASASASGGSTRLVVLDDEALTEGRRAPARTLLRGAAGAAAGIVIASTADRLPAVCTTVVVMEGPDGEARLERPQTGERVAGFLAGGLSDEVARICARSLARFDDPELDVAGAGLPDRARLLPLLGLDQVDASAIERRWVAGGPDPAPATPIGVTDDDVFVVDLVRDGPHGLVAGTTGSGKSELLRTLVAGLASSVDPDHLTFVLVDFKGGSAFDECARLPHTVGLVTDLDEHLAERALRCLEAELRHRERLLRAAGAVDLHEYRRGADPPEPLPRLVVVIDEFATLKAELPDFVDALVGVAQRGRSLGVHLVLATQRPSGAVSDNIRANTNLRVALRVQDAADSSDVIGVADAAAIPRARAGRAYVRLGPGELVAIQTALSTAAASDESVAPVDVAPFQFGPSPRRSAGDATPPTDRTPATDLSMLVDAIGSAFTRSGRPAPRRPWPDPLPSDVALESLASTDDDGLVAFALGRRPRGAVAVRGRVAAA